MPGKPSLRRRLIVSYLIVVAAVVGAAFVTVQVLVPQFFEQAVQERLGPGPGNGTNQQQGQDDPPGQGQGNQDGQGNGQGNGQTTSTTAVDPAVGSTTSTAPTTSTDPAPTGSTMGPGGGEPGSGDGGENPNPGNGSGEPGGNPDPGSESGGRGGGSPTPTTVDAFGGIVLGTSAAAPSSGDTDRSPVPVEIQQDYDRALTLALLVSTVIGLAIATVLGWWLTRRLLRTFTGIKDGASKLADGYYDVRVPVPAEVELADLAESVNTLADSLERTEHSRARLVSDLAHEIRNPLSTIEGYMEGLIDGVLPPTQDTYQAVAAEAHRLKRLTMDLSTLSKAQEGAIEFEFVRADLAHTVERVAATLRAQYEINNVALLVSMTGAMPVNIDEDRIAQAVTNLLGNALSYTPAGGEVHVAGGSDEGSCWITITDTGEGIPEAHLETIFERFTRLDSNHPGTGIGLNIARTLVRAHGGDITVSSPGAGTGSTFRLTLPRLIA